jgi:hypothetical protein
MIKTVIRFQNNMVAVFDGRGEQIPKYQGQYEEVRGSILKNAPPDAVFTYGFTDFGEFRELQKVPRVEW